MDLYAGSIIRDGAFLTCKRTRTRTCYVAFCLLAASADSVFQHQQINSEFDTIGLSCSQQSIALFQ
jgi:hypothetical protein